MQDEQAPAIPFGTEFSLTVPWQQGRYEATYRKIARRWDEGLAEPYDDAVFVLTMLRAVLVRLEVRRGDASTRVSQTSWEQYPPAFLRALLVAIDEDLRRQEVQVLEVPGER